jgi:hypothetical protein
VLFHLTHSYTPRGAQLPSPFRQHWAPLFCGPFYNQICGSQEHSLSGAFPCGLLRWPAVSLKAGTASPPLDAASPTLTQLCLPRDRHAPCRDIGSNPGPLRTRPGHSTCRWPWSRTSRALIVQGGQLERRLLSPVPWSGQLDIGPYIKDRLIASFGRLTGHLGANEAKCHQQPGTVPGGDSLGMGAWPPGLNPSRDLKEGASTRQVGTGQVSM